MELTADEKINEIWKLFQETDRKFQETDRKFQETAVRFQETDKKFLETDKKFQETAVRFQETDRKFQETDKKFQETARKIDELANLFTSQWGKLIEALVEPGVLQLFRDRAINVKQTFRRAESRRNGDTMEIDLLLTNDDELVVVEVKTTLKVEHIREFLDDLAQFPIFFPRYRNCAIYGAVAALHIEEEADRYAYRQGLFVLKPGKEGIIRILNDMKFKPKRFGQ
jgi:predicted transcriptional regulator